jgi:hypothetical protein
MRVVKWALWCILKIMVVLWSECQRMLCCHAFYVLCCHTELSFQIDNMRYVVYCVTDVYLGGNVLTMARCNAWILSSSLYSPHGHCTRIILVTVAPFSYMACHVSVRFTLRNFGLETCVSRASVSWV